ncbi:DUF3089 domain-containing protein [Qipengyuania marisflavi]|uniref:DUF3089 domain-containing protein n=1 Tax=Qipengyuania marisflavi TaxID=2486356 RepID=A0A5S3PYQ0_9SPHN|nr:DUF3089 domain-containing protein [Qipengyuania marisflavi]TMM48946.1 DUF3089 domain-containing protein [Qipengyuania marisflavi]
MVRKFLYLVAVVIVLFIAGAVALSIWSREATQIAFVPRGEFVEQAPLQTNAYQDPAMWYSRPGIGVDDPARYQPGIAEIALDPAEQAPSPDTPAAEQSLDSPAPFDTQGALPGEPADAQATPGFAVFFVHPTSYIREAVSADWNAALEDPTAENRARLFIKGMASPFNRADEIWAPKYRQAVAGAFLTDKPEADLAIDMAYRDVALAFDFFVASVDQDKPIVLAGHSQGAAHVLRLLRDKVAGTPLEARMAAVYAPGWPISVAHDLPALPIPACAAPTQSGCLLGWSSFADDGDPDFIMDRYKATPGFDGQPRGDGPILCVNPLTGMTGGAAAVTANLGTLVPDETLTSGELVANAVGARCDPRGLLLIGDPPALGQGVLPGSNYHVYDIPLFWKNLQEDVVRRVGAWTASRS